MIDEGRRRGGLHAFTTWACGRIRWSFPLVAGWRKDNETDDLRMLKMEQGGEKREAGREGDEMRRVES